MYRCAAEVSQKPMVPIIPFLDVSLACNSKSPGVSVIIDPPPTTRYTDLSRGYNFSSDGVHFRGYTGTF